MPIHPELHGALSSALAYGDINQGRIVEAHTYDRMALGAGGCETCRGTGGDSAGEADRDPHAAPQLRTPPADERDTHQLPVALAGAFVDSDDTHLP